MPISARDAVFGGKLICRSVALPAVGGRSCQRYGSTPFHDNSFNDSSAQGNDLPFRIALDMTAFAVVLIQPAGRARREQNVRHLSAAFRKKPVERSQARDASLDLQGRHPLLWSSSGIGLGSWNFSCRVPQFKIFYTTFFVNEAHNDYVQLLAEMALLGSTQWCGSRQSCTDTHGVRLQNGPDECADTRLGVTVEERSLPSVKEAKFSPR